MPSAPFANQDVGVRFWSGQANNQTLRSALTLRRAKVDRLRVRRSVPPGRPGEPLGIVALAHPLDHRRAQCGIGQLAHRLEDLVRQRKVGIVVFAPHDLLLYIFNLGPQFVPRLAALLVHGHAHRQRNDRNEDAIEHAQFDPARVQQRVGVLLSPCQHAGVEPPPLLAAAVGGPRVILRNIIIAIRHVEVAVLHRPPIPVGGAVPIVAPLPGNNACSVIALRRTLVGRPPSHPLVLGDQNVLGPEGTLALLNVMNIILKPLRILDVLFANTMELGSLSLAALDKALSRYFFVLYFLFFRSNMSV